MFETISYTVAMPEHIKGTKGLKRGQKKYLVEDKEIILNPDEVEPFLTEWEIKVNQDISRVHERQRELYRFREQGRMSRIGRGPLRVRAVNGCLSMPIS